VALSPAALDDGMLRFALGRLGIMDVLAEVRTEPSDGTRHIYRTASQAAALTAGSNPPIPLAARRAASLVVGKGATWRPRSNDICWHRHHGERLERAQPRFRPSDFGVIAGIDQCDNEAGGIDPKHRLLELRTFIWRERPQRGVGRQSCVDKLICSA
jgi:hypothetical protein